MKISILLFAGMLLTLLACNNSEKVPNDLPDTYYGMLPCADCPGIYYELDINPDFTYSEKRFYLESEVDTMTEKGTFEIQNDTLLLLKNAENGVNKMKISDGNLTILDGDGNEINSPLKEFFVLKTTKPTEISRSKNPILEQKFNATGNEPFWAVEIDPKKNTISFREMEGSGITVSIPQAEISDEKIIYRTNAEPNILEVSILKKTCQDGMSGEMFTHQVSVTVKTSEMNETRTYMGCGEYSVGQKEAKALAGKWVLENLNRTLVGKNTEFNAPTLEIDLEENRAMGNAGCNQYSGKIDLLEANQLKFSQLISTKMACPALEMETKFLKILSEENLTYAVNEGKLTLSNNDVSLIFKKMDDGQKK